MDMDELDDFTADSDKDFDYGLGPFICSDDCQHDMMVDEFGEIF